MIQSYELNKSKEKDPWDPVLPIMLFAVQTTVHTMLSVTDTTCAWMGCNTQYSISSRLAADTKVQAGAYENRL